MSDLSHVGASGKARMVDVTDKPVTERVARAEGWAVMDPDTLAAIRGNTLAKGDVVTVAKVAGIAAAKRTAELIPLCHPLALTDVHVELTEDASRSALRAESVVRVVGRTGAEVEAIVAVTVALVTVYDMVKAIDRGVRITDVCLLEKSGGRSGRWTRK